MYSCVECDEVITNPISEERLALAFRVWLGETRPELEELFTDMYVSKADFMNDDQVHRTSCIVSGDKMDLCPFCTAKQFIGWLYLYTNDRRLMKQAAKYFLSTRDHSLLLKTKQVVHNEQVILPLLDEELNEFAII